MFKNNNPRVLFLSYPRSGNTWVRYCLEYLTKTETLDTGIYDETETHEETFKGIFKRDKNIRPFIYKRHFHNEISDFNVNEDFLIFLLRNYKECLTRHLLNDLKNKRILTREIDSYIKNIGLYEKWNKNKLLIYYEDLMTNFDFVFNQIVDFLNLDKNRYKKLIKNFDYHREKSIQLYAISVTKGDDLDYHSKKLSINFKNKLDAYIIKNAKLIFTKYLVRYQEKRSSLKEFLRSTSINFISIIMKLALSTRYTKIRDISLKTLDLIQIYLKTEKF